MWIYGNISPKGKNNTVDFWLDYAPSMLSSTCPLVCLALTVQFSHIPS